MATKTNVKNMDHALHYLNTAVLITFSIVAIGVHRNQVHIDKVCTDYNVPASCATAGSGRFRALNFTATTTSVYFTDFSEAQYKNIPHPDSTLLYAIDPKTEKTMDTPEEIEDYPFGSICNETYFTTVAKDKEDSEATIEACEATKIPHIFEISNIGTYYRSAWNLSGGIHIFYFIWLSLWIAASFQVLIAPEYSYFQDNVKYFVLLLWHFVGITLSIVYYIDDDYFRMRLPLNNAILGVIFEGFAILVQFYMLQSSSYYKKNNGGGIGAKAVSAPAQSMMRIGDNRNYTSLGADSSPTPQEIFHQKKEGNELLEFFFLDCVFTLPLVMLAFFCISSRVNMSWELELLYVRLLLLFLTFSVLFATFSAVSSNKMAKDLHNVPQIVLGIASIVIVFNAIATYYSFIAAWNEMYDVWGDAFNGGVYTPMFTVIVIIGIVLFVSVLSIGVLNFGPYLSASKDEDNDNVMDYWIFVAFSVALLVLRTIAFTFIVSPGLWYEAYDKNDVLLHYGY